MCRVLSIPTFASLDTSLDLLHLLLASVSVHICTLKSNKDEMYDGDVVCLCNAHRQTEEPLRMDRMQIAIRQTMFVSIGWGVFAHTAIVVCARKS